MVGCIPASVVAALSTALDVSALSVFPIDPAKLPAPFPPTPDQWTDQRSQHVQRVAVANTTTVPDSGVAIASVGDNRLVTEPGGYGLCDSRRGYAARTAEPQQTRSRCDLVGHVDARSASAESRH